MLRLVRYGKMFDLGSPCKWVSFYNIEGILAQQLRHKKRCIYLLKASSCFIEDINYYIE